MMDDIKIVSLLHRLNMIQAAGKIVILTIATHLPENGQKEVLEAMSTYDEQDKFFEKELEAVLDEIEKGRKNG